MAYEDLSAGTQEIIECFWYWPYCPKTKYGVCVPPFVGTSTTSPGGPSKVVGTPTVEIVEGKFIPHFVAAREKCAVRDVPPEPIQGNQNANTPSPSLASGTPTEFTQSQYGLMIPIVFGQDKLGGNTFWYNGFERDYTTTPEGDITYFVKTSFAIGFCEGEIESVTRVWFGDKVLIDNTARVDGSGIIQPTDGEILSASIDLFDADSPLGSVEGVETTAQVKIFSGSEQLLPLGVMVDNEGYDNTPAYRGMCFLLFENLLVQEGTIPNIFIEVISGADVTMPRAYLDLADSTLFDDRNGDNITFLPQFDKVVVDGDDAAGGKLGYMLLNAGDMSIEEEYLIPDEDGVFDDSYASTQANHVVTPTGKIYQNYTAGNPGRSSVFDFVTGTKTFQSAGGEGGINSHGTNGFATLIATGMAAVRMQNAHTNEYVDYVYGVGLVNDSVGLAHIDNEGQFLMIGSSNNTLGGSSNERIQLAPFEVHDNVRTNNPVFVDGTTTFAPSALIVHHNINETSALDVKLYSFRVNTTTEQFQGFPVTMTPISYQNFQGVGITHLVPIAFVHESTGNLILAVEGANTNTWFCSYNPFTGLLNWISEYPSNFRGASITHPNNFTRVIDSIIVPMNNGALVRVNVFTGGITVVADDYVTDQSLPQISTGSAYSYDGVSDSIFYMSDTDTQAYVRVYAGRATSSGVAVGTIVKTLLNRVGIYKDQINVSDVEALSITGYTIPAIKSLRSAFGELASVVKFDLFESDGAISYLSRGDTSVLTLAHEDLEIIDTKGWVSELQEPDFQGARKINLSYRDVDRDYTINVQSIHLPKYDRTDFDEEAAISVTSPVVLTATEAKVLAEILLYSKIVYTSTYDITTSLKNIKIDPGDVITVERDDTNSFLARVRETSMGANKNIDIKLTKEDPTIYNDTVTLFGSTGRFTKSIIGAYQTLTDIAWLNIPFFSTEQGEQFDEDYKFFATLIPWFEGGTPPFAMMQFTPEDPARQYSFEGPTTFPTWGTATTNLTDTNASFSTDYTSSIVVSIRNTGAVTPTSAASEDAALQNANINLMYISGELVQFVNATDNMDGTYTLDTFNRGKFGTDNYTAGHVVGERIIFLSNQIGTFDNSSHMILNGHTDPGAINPDSHPQDALHRVVLAGDSDNPFQEPFRKGVYPYNLFPWPVAALEIIYDGGGDADASWEYRDRWGVGEWEDDGDESTEIINRELTDTVTAASYDIWWFDDPSTFDPTDDTTYFKTETVATEAATYTSAEQTTDSFDNTASKLYCLVKQNGTFIPITPYTQGAIANIGVQ